jgi:hypothetical protein
MYLRTASVALILLASAGKAEAQGQPSIIAVQLEAAARALQQEEFTERGARHSGGLAEGDSAVIVLQLEAGLQYLVVGVCDEDCSDLDFDITGPTGEQVDEDYELDDTPIVAAEVKTAGGYSLTVSMAGCSVELCGFAVAVFAKSP